MLWPAFQVSALWGYPWHLGPSRWPQRETWSFLPQSPGGQKNTHRWLITQRSTFLCVICYGSGDLLPLLLWCEIMAIKYSHRGSNVHSALTRSCAKRVVMVVLEVGGGRRGTWRLITKYCHDNKRTKCWWLLWEILCCGSHSASYFHALYVQTQGNAVEWWGVPVLTRWMGARC